MKKVVAIALGALMAASMLAPASAGKPKPQVVEGSVLLPLPFLDDSGCYAGSHRRAALATAGNNNKVTGYHFDVDKATWGGLFDLEATGGQGYVDFDIYFYSDFGAFGNPDDPLVNEGFLSAQYNTREAGGEEGTVPPEMNKVIVCMYSGALGQGFNGTFKYTATPPVKKKKK